MNFTLFYVIIFSLWSHIILTLFQFNSDETYTRLCKENRNFSSSSTHLYLLLCAFIEYCSHMERRKFNVNKAIQLYFSYALLSLVFIWMPVSCSLNEKFFLHFYFFCHCFLLHSFTRDVMIFLVFFHQLACWHTRVIFSIFFFQMLILLFLLFEYPLTFEYS